MDDELKELARRSVQHALADAPERLGAALAEFGWNELAATDPAFAFTTLFEEQGYLARDTDALDVVTVAALGITGPARVVWPLHAVTAAAAPAPAPEELTVDGVALGGLSGSGCGILVPAEGHLCALDASSLDETPLTGMAHDLAWVRVRVRGVRTNRFAAWSEVERRAHLAIASEIVGVGQRIVDLAVAHASERRQFGRPIGANQAVRHRLAEAHSDVVGARALVAAAWEDGSTSAAAWAKAAAGTAHDAAAKHAIQVCAAIGLSEEHELPRLVRLGFALDALLGSAMALHERLGAEGFSSVPPVAVGDF
jgi:Acyl-CoA dehydrogenase, C-terminal domain